MSTWNHGRRRLGERMQEQSLPLAAFECDVLAHPPVRVPGTAVFMTGNPHSTPTALLHNLKHNHILHEHVVILHVCTCDVPTIPVTECASVEDRGGGIVVVTMRFGFKEQPDVPARLAVAPLGFPWMPLQVSYFLGRESLVLGRGGIPTWRANLFASMSRNARSAAAFFSLPANRVVELGMQVEV